MCGATEPFFLFYIMENIVEKLKRLKNSKITLVSEVDVLKYMQQYNDVLKFFGLEISKIKGGFIIASEQIPEYDFDIIFYTNDGNTHHGYFDHEHNKFISNAQNYAFPIESVKHWKELVAPKND